ncbi:MAG: hypothetical protein WCK58_17680 [Chloroflexota bacterium]
MNPVGILAAITLVAGTILLVAYVLQRGLVHRALDGTDDEAAALAAHDPTAPTGTAARRPRRKGSSPTGGLGVLLLVVGLLLSFVAFGGNPTATANPGVQPTECVAGWNGCPATTPKP